LNMNDREDNRSWALEHFMEVRPVHVSNASMQLSVFSTVPAQKSTTQPSGQDGCKV
jgi:hypothetical protein